MHAMHATRPLGRRSAAPWAADDAQRAPHTCLTLRNTPPPVVAVARACNEVQWLVQPSPQPRQLPEQGSAAAVRLALH